MLGPSRSPEFDFSILLRVMFRCAIRQTEKKGRIGWKQHLVISVDTKLREVMEVLSFPEKVERAKLANITRVGNIQKSFCNLGSFGFSPLSGWKLWWASPGLRARGVTAEQANPHTFGIFPPDSPSKHAILLKNTEEEVATICFVWWQVLHTQSAPSLDTSNISMILIHLQGRSTPCFAAGRVSY